MDEPKKVMNNTTERRRSQGRQCADCSRAGLSADLPMPLNPENGKAIRVSPGKSLRFSFWCLLSAGFLVVMLFAGGCGKDEEKGSDKQHSKQESSAGQEVQKRQKIEQLGPKSFIEVTLELKKEEKKWRKEWQEFMQKKRQQYFASFGITEEEFNEYPINNQKEFQRFLKENPRYNRMLMELQRQENYQP